MASANWMKMNNQKAGAMTIHLGTEERASHDHSNKHIDPEKSYLNTTIGCNDYKEALQKLRDRNAEVDRVLPPQRDMGARRVVACSIEIPCPYQIQEQGKDQEFFEVMYKAMQDYFGADNVHGGFVHRDEQHLYHDKHGNECISLYHMHTLVSPYTDKGINGKAFETKKRLKEFNTLVNRECERVFGIELNTHTMEEGGQSVELLKAQEAVHTMNAQIATKQAQNDGLDETQRTLTKTIVKKMDAMDEAEDKFQNLYRNIQAQSKYLADHAFEMSEAEIRKKQKHISSMVQEMDTMDLSDCFER